MTRASIIAVGACALALAGAPAGANDSTASLAAGGLVLTKSASIAMRSEDLYLSERQVRVRYGFENTSDKDVTVEVAFPMPDLTPDPEDIEGAPVDPESPANFLGFATRVDGQPVKAEVELKAVMNGVDRTALLRGLNVPLFPWQTATAKALDRLPKARSAELVKLGLVDAPNSDPDVSEEQRHFRPLWTLKTTYFWRQTFPAHRLVAIEHSYAPVVGGWVTSYWVEPPPTDPDSQAARRKEQAFYCVDQPFIASARALVAGGKFRVQSNYLKYVLVTGANWMGPIGDFRMTVDKGASANLVSFCGQGVRKTGPTTFEVRYRDFKPTKNVGVLILKTEPE